MPKLTKLKIERLKRGWTLWQVASEIGVSETLISHWENGMFIPEKWLQKLANLYGVPEENLKGDIND